MIQLTMSIATFYGVEGATIRIYCDNEETMRYKPMSKSTYTTLTKRDTDLKIEM